MKRLVFKSVLEEETRLAMLKRGEADIAYSVRGPLAEELRRTPGLTLMPTYPSGTFWLVFPEQWTDPKSPWADRRVRLAASHAIDRPAINQAETLGFSKLIGSIIPYTFDGFWQPPLHAYDVHARQAAPGRGGLRRAASTRATTTATRRTPTSARRW